MARLARLAVAGDTGPMHLAAAVGTPCVSLHGPSEHERNGPYGNQHVCLQEIYVAGSSRQRRRASDEALRAISVEQVASACDRILEQPAPSARVA